MGRTTIGSAERNHRAHFVNVDVTVERVFAVTRFSGFERRDVVAQQMSELSEKLRDDGSWE